MKLKFIIDKEYDKKFIKNKEILRYIDVQYKLSLKFLKLTVELYQKSWDEINDEFSNYIEEVTGYKWSYDKYECIVSVVHKGISNWGTSSKIIRGWKENPYTMRRITAHELIVSHYFKIYKKYYNKENLTNEQVWVLAEVAAFALTSLTPQVKNFWPWDTEYYINHNYSHIIDIQKQLKDVFLQNSFNVYIKTGIDMIKKYPAIKVYPYVK